MAEVRNLKISVENFGPIKEGEFELKPLTIFIGPNNSGKSYMALLVYALSKVLSGRLHWPSIGLFRREDPEGEKYLEEHRKELGEWFREVYSRKSGERRDLPFKDLPENIQQVFQRVFDQTLSTLQEDLKEAIPQYFGCENNVKDLVMVGESQRTLSVRLNESRGGDLFLSLKVAPNGNEIMVQWSTPDIGDLLVPLSKIREFFPPFARRDLRSMADNASFLVQTSFISLWSEFLRANGITPQDEYYLPPARSGILAGWPAFVSQFVKMVQRRFGLEPIEMPPITGVTGDFLQVLLERTLPSSPFFPRRKDAPRMMRPALEILEGNIFRGEVSVETTRPELLQILYKSGSLQLPLHRASSMVGELAPLDFWIKHLLSPGDLLVMDEPEAHLHPENQRLIARVLVRLARAGVRVLCTTHSSLILHQISNHLLASAGDPKAREEVGYTEDDLIKDEEVGVYHFEMKRDGTHIKPVPIEPGFGISEEEFVRVAEAIGDETYRLSILK